MSDGGDIPRTPNQDRREGTQKSNRRPDTPPGDFPPSKKQRPDDQTDGNRRNPNIRICNLVIGPEEYGYATRVLTPAEVDPTNPVLRISNDYEHSVFLHNHSLVENPDFAGSILYRVYDGNMRQYNMRLSRAKIFGSMHVSLSGWDTIVRDCGLRAGDKVWFQRSLNTAISDDFFYMFNRIPLDDGKNDGEADNIFPDTSSAKKKVLKLVYRRLPLDETVQGPGSRDFPQEAHCISKKVTWYNVTPGKGKLFLSATDAVILTDDPRIVQLPTDCKYEKDIEVFDGENHRYTMTVTAHYSWDRRVFYYCLGGEWNDFATGHNLKEGDLLMIYKCLDSTFSSRYYHVFRYVLKREYNRWVRFNKGKVQGASQKSACKEDFCMI